MTEPQQQIVKRLEFIATNVRDWHVTGRNCLVREGVYLTGSWLGVFFNMPALRYVGLFMAAIEVTYYTFYIRPNLWRAIDKLEEAQKEIAQKANTPE